jgi:TetR/AcrR family transcriptional regulator
MPKQTFFNLPEEKRQAILDVVIEAFAENEYSQVSISRLVEKAGIAKGSFYQYFTDKKDLFLYLLELGAQKKLEMLKSVPPPDPHMGMFAYIEHLLRSGMEFQGRYPALSRVAVQALYGNLSLRDESLQRMKDAASHYYVELIEMGVAQGDVDPQIDRPMAAFVLSAVFNDLGNYFLRQIGADPATLAERQFTPQEFDLLQGMAGEAIQILKTGLGKRNGC